jgi:hypothetical protein
MSKNKPLDYVLQTRTSASFHNWLDAKEAAAHDRHCLERLTTILRENKVKDSPYFIGSGEMHAIFSSGVLANLEKPTPLALRVVSPNFMGGLQRIVMYAQNHLAEELARFEEAYDAIAQGTYENISTSFQSPELHSLPFAGIVSWLKPSSKDETILSPRYGILTADIGHAGTRYVASLPASETAGVWERPPEHPSEIKGQGTFFGEYFIDPVHSPQDISRAEKYFQPEAILHLGRID